MEIKQYLSQREQREIDEATAELDKFVLELFEDDKHKPSVTWDDIQLDDDVRKSPLVSLVTMNTPTAEVHAMLDTYANSPTIQTGLREAEKMEAKATSIDCYELKKIEFDNPRLNEYFTIRKPQVTAVIDWLRLEMAVSPTYTFSHPSKAFQDIRKFLKDNRINENARVDQSPINANIFTFDIHDIADIEQFERITALLYAEYGATNIKITTLELSLDFWHIGARPLLIALAKSVRVNGSVTDRDFRVYLSGTQYRTIPCDPRKAMKYLNKGYTIGIGHRDNDDVYIRAYFKTKDHGNYLPLNQQRMRIEVNLSGQALENLGNNANNLKCLINDGFKYLQFTKLNDRATVEEVKRYYNKIELFGRETSIISKSRHKRKLPDFIKSHADLNRVISKAVYNLCRKF